MAHTWQENPHKLFIDPNGLQQLIEGLHRAGYHTMGPKVRHNAIVYDQLQSIADLPVGWHDRQSPGRYELEHHGDQTLFDYNLGPDSWKKFLYPAVVQLWQARKTDSGFQLQSGKAAAPSYALIGVRACELSAIERHSMAVNSGHFTPPTNAEDRLAPFILAMNCTRPGNTCFCTSMQTGPEAKSGFDIVLTEITDRQEHGFIARAGSDVGSRMLARIDGRSPDGRQEEMAETIITRARKAVGRSLDTSGLKSLFDDHWDHPHWEEVARRCLACGNCTMVCPTCFCTDVVDASALDGEMAGRRRLWDSCFTQAFSYIHGGSLRVSIKARYRQWLTHKLATWMDQFGTLGCVGCGRCITWCPVGIDITQEAQAILAK